MIAMPNGRPRVKVCGVTRLEDAVQAARCGADFLGLNFHPPSPRYVEPGLALELAAAARQERPEIAVVGVFVNREAAEVEGIAATARLDLLQFHGDETREEIAPFAARAIKVLRVSDRIDPTALEAYPDVWGHLVDYRHPELYGGSGESWDFSSLAGLRPSPRQGRGHPPAGRPNSAKPLFIAGGLDPANIRAALAASGAWGVDVCSGIESSPGSKDSRLLDRFFAEIDRHVKENE